MTQDEQRLLDYLRDNEAELTALLGRLVDTDSNSHDHPGVEAVFAVLSAFLTDEGIATSPITRDDRVIAISAKTGADQYRQMLLGHCDTVFPTGEAKRRPFTVRDGRGTGPGILDMKGGVAINAFILAALHKLGVGIPIAALFTGDEEIASPLCRPVIEDMARASRVVFNGEPGRPSGNIVTRRKGSLFCRVDGKGVPAHSGANFTDGRSAIQAVALLIPALHALTDLDAGVTVNVGLMQGGISVNTTAENAWCEIDIRYVRPEQREPILAEVQKLVNANAVDGTSLSFTIKGEFLPLVEDDEQRKISSLYLDVSAELGRPTSHELSGGCADSGFTAAVGTPTICGLGPVGQFPHTPREYIEMPTLLQRAEALAVTMLRLHAGTLARA